MKIAKKFLSLIFVCVMILALTACSDKNLEQNAVAVKLQNNVNELSTVIDKLDNITNEDIIINELTFIDNNFSNLQNPTLTSRKKTTSNSLQNKNYKTTTKTYNSKNGLTSTQKNGQDVERQNKKFKQKQIVSNKSLDVVLCSLNTDASNLESEEQSKILNNNTSESVQKNNVKNLPYKLENLDAAKTTNLNKTNSGSKKVLNKNWENNNSKNILNKKLNHKLNEPTSSTAEDFKPKTKQINKLNKPNLRNTNNLSKESINDTTSQQNNANDTMDYSNGKKPINLDKVADNNTVIDTNSQLRDFDNPLRDNLESKHKNNNTTNNNAIANDDSTNNNLRDNNNALYPYYTEHNNNTNNNSNNAEQLDNNYNNSNNTNETNNQNVINEFAKYYLDKNLNQTDKNTTDNSNNGLNNFDNNTIIYYNKINELSRLLTSCNNCITNITNCENALNTCIDSCNNICSDLKSGNLTFSENECEECINNCNDINYCVKELENCKGYINVNKSIINKFKNNVSINIDTLLEEYSDLLNNLENRLDCLENCEENLCNIINIANDASIKYASNQNSKNSFKKSSSKFMSNKPINISSKKYEKGQFKHIPLKASQINNKVVMHKTKDIKEIDRLFMQNEQPINNKAYKKNNYIKEEIEQFLNTKYTSNKSIDYKNDFSALNNYFNLNKTTDTPSNNNNIMTLESYEPIENNVSLKKNVIR